MFQLSLPEILLILTIALLVFGPKRLPEMGRSLGKGLREMRGALDGLNTDTILDPEPSRAAAAADDDADLDEMIADDDPLDDADDEPTDDADEDDWPDDSSAVESSADDADEAAADTA